MINVAITGAGGFIGKALCHYFLNKGDFVYGIDLSLNGLENLENNNNFKAIIQKKNEPLCFKEITKQLDVFYHIAWGGSLLAKDLRNIDLQLNNVRMSCSYLNEMIALNCKKIVFCSSSYQYMYFKDTDIDANIYGIAKGMTSRLYAQICMNNNVDYNIAILTNTFGVGDKSSKAVNTFIRLMEKQEDMKLVDGNSKNDWVYIDDTVKGLYEIGKKGINGKRYYIGHIEIPTFKDSIKQMKELLGYKKKLNFGTYPENTYIDYREMNANELYLDTGFICSTDFSKAINKTAKWLYELDKGDVL